MCVCLSVSLSETLHVKLMVDLPYVIYCDLQDDCRSKVMEPNERIYLSSYLHLIVTIGLSGTITEI